jgi:hypothetical protein
MFSSALAVWYVGWRLPRSQKAERLNLAIAEGAETSNQEQN